FIHPDVFQSCQLTLGFTMIEPGSVCNTMPAHTHDLRMEAYLYFDLEAEQRVFHFLVPAPEWIDQGGEMTACSLATS
ncbi:hypothetical protein AB9F38_36690, partial [Rhizobium leguminosarum]